MQVDAKASRLVNISGLNTEEANQGQEQLIGSITKEGRGEDRKCKSQI